MSRPAQQTEMDEARRVIGMLEAVSDPDEYQQLFGISDETVNRYLELTSSVSVEVPSFIES